MNAEDFEVFERSIGIASKTLSIAAMISVKRNYFRKLKPDRSQIGWSYGFCDSYAQTIGLVEDNHFITFISCIFENVYGKSGLKYFKDVALLPDNFSKWMLEGGNAHLNWVHEGKSPLMPMRS
ncbi:hypothetical protein [Parasphingorhabdus sp.]|uniref:hypothetical protein n=2 Tax=Parasphingorhabdus sp. TaxID=2709688 RepID=UPI0032EFED10